MATFFLGQRVRIRYCLFRPELSGRETRVTGPLQQFVRPNGEPYMGYDVEIDPDFGPKPDQLEPILPSGHRAGDYSLSELLDRCRAGEGVPA